MDRTERIRRFAGAVLLAAWAVFALCVWLVLLVPLEAFRMARRAWTGEAK